MSGIRPAAYDESNLFDPHTVMIDQEDRLALKMRGLSMTPVISKFMVAYHFKSFTVSRAAISKNGTLTYKLSDGNDSRENLSYYHPELSAEAIS